MLIHRPFIRASSTLGSINPCCTSWDWAWSTDVLGEGSSTPFPQQVPGQLSQMINFFNLFLPPPLSRGIYPITLQRLLVPQGCQQPNKQAAYVLRALASSPLSPIGKRKKAFLGLKCDLSQMHLSPCYGNNLNFVGLHTLWFPLVFVGFMYGGWW